jgi:glycosyltransferase involved in cell wall biosynthesis
VKILVVSFYFHPDLSAGSFRTTALVDSLCQLAPAGSTIDVLTTLPQRYHSFTAEAPEREERGAVSIRRMVLPGHQGGIVDQSRAFLSFARQASREVASRPHDVVFATSSRLMTAVLGAWLALRTRAALYLDIRDIFVDTIGDVMPGAVAALTKPLFSTLERWAVGRADRVNLVSRGFARYFEPRYPRQSFTYFTNGIDDEFMPAGDTPAPARPATNGAPLTVLYAGNIGEGQGLHVILPALARRMGRGVRFQIIGDGGRRRALEQALAATGVDNVELRPPVPRDELLRLYRRADVLFLHLNAYAAFEKVLPSKIFEYAALGKPVWAGVSGHAAEFIGTEVPNAAVFRPCDVDGAVQTFAGLVLEDRPRAAFLAKYSRAAISRAMARDVLSIARDGR